MVRKYKVHTLQKEIRKFRREGKKIGFVPTMGALHDGHISLINQSNELADCTVCSIFVNPTQFNDPTDLQKYPRTLSSDSKMLKAAGCEILFAPSVEDIYPEGDDFNLSIELNGLDAMMEGAHRPGHFQGVVQVVKRLLDIVQPDFLMMGQKDFQQFTIIQHMIDFYQLPVKLIVCPIIREKNGLARSSRNERLKPHLRKQAGIIYETLNYIQQNIDNKDINFIVKEGMSNLTIPGFKPEYISIVDGFTLREVVDPADHDYIVACIAVWAGEVRLIDNLIIKQ